AERAVVAALGAQAAIARLPLPRAARHARISARVGITTGRVFVGPLGGAGAEAGDPGRGGPRPRPLTIAPREKLAVIGDAVGAAARLQQLAPRGAIVIGRDTHRLLRGRFQIEPIEAAGGPPMYRVIGEGGSESGRSSWPSGSSRRGPTVA